MFVKYPCFIIALSLIFFCGISDAADHDNTSITQINTGKGTAIGKADHVVINNPPPKKVKKMFLEGETPNAAIPITDGVPIIGKTVLTQFRSDGKMFPNQKCLVSSGTEVKILQKEPKTVTATILGVPVNFGDFLTVTKVQIVGGSHKGTIGWAPTNLLRERIVEQTD